MEKVVRMHVSTPWPTWEERDDAMHGLRHGITETLLKLGTDIAPRV